MNVISPNGVKIYNLSAGKSLPQWISEKKRAALKKDKEFSRRIELIQDFEFPTAAQRLKVSSDGRFIAGVGTYKPRVRVWDLAELSLKFERYLDHDVQQFQLLASDYSKIVFLRGDRTLEFHAQFGTYYSTRIPKYGRDMLYNANNCEIYTACSGSEVYRLNLEFGRFMAPLETEMESVNVCGLNPAHGLLGFGGEGGLVEMWDPRTHKRVGSLNVGSDAILQSAESGHRVVPSITALRFHEDGLRFICGSDEGHILSYDLRSSRPLLFKEHQYGLPIIGLKYAHRTEQVISGDPKIVKVWDEKTGAIMATVEPKANMNDLCYLPNTGMILAGCEQSKVEIYFIPALGPAPSWCAFLENLTEELEEDKQPLFDDYKFVTRQELERMGLEKMIGTEYLRAYMHGFFMDQKLYAKVKGLSDQFSWEQYKDNAVGRKVDASTSRIAVQRKAAAQKVNKELAQKNTVLVADSRFSKLFSDSDFAIDKNSPEYQRVLPRAQKGNLKEKKAAVDVVEYFDPVESSEEEEEKSKRQKKSHDESITKTRPQTANPDSKKSRRKQPLLMEVKAQEGSYLLLPTHTLEHGLQLGASATATHKPATGSFGKLMRSGLHERKASRSHDGAAVITAVSSQHLATQERLAKAQEARNEAYRCRHLLIS